MRLCSFHTISEHDASVSYMKTGAWGVAILKLPLRASPFPSARHGIG